MSKRYRLWAATLLAVSLNAQDTATVRGHLTGADESTLNEYVIELTNLATRTIVVRIDISFNGDFTARNVPVGEYLARVATYHGDTIAQQMVTINQSLMPLDLRLPSRPATPSGRTVSAAELRHPPRRQALDASQAAQRFADSGKFDRAASELEKAVRISPDFAAAHSSLGVQYLRLQRYEDAAAELGRAIEIAGPNPTDLSNLAYAHLSLERFAEAATNARAALKLRKDQPAAHFVLGLTLVLDPETKGEGIAHLEEAAKKLDSARKALTALGH